MTTATTTPATAASRVRSLEISDIRFPTSRELDGSDAMNPDPDYSAAYVRMTCDDESEGDGFVFTIGRGNEVVVAALQALAPLLEGRAVGTPHDLAEASRALLHDSQLRWLGPEKGVMHMAVGAVVNALWDRQSRVAGVPLWEYLSFLSPEEIVDQVDFRYLSDALSHEQALDILRAAEPGREQRAASLREQGYPAYTTSPGWLGYSDEKMVRLAEQAVAEGFTQIKLKVGADLEDDVRRLKLAREVVGPDIRIAIDANQRWDVDDAVNAVQRLSPWDPYWIEEPTSPDDVLAHAAIRRQVGPVKVATGEHGQNRVIFKQLLQAGAIDILQMDAARVAGVNENLAIILLAARFGVPLCPHAGGVGLCELVQHLSMFDYVAVSGSMEDRVVEYVDHLHEHFEDPAVVRGGRYAAPTAAGFSARMHAESRERFAFPGGAAWATT
ncbi:enolase C-terminal domain-like protein [Nocardioides flavescens]|uniref:Fuconate dehydratase n=1 Tax=Nocardioides flavescens TaxID=2691959 RepID=A0A6L7EPG2_9ACTN|nr:enolase C-terminal domain-like protein [Nocardioides flavescens]MXG89257.1 fuconate dehydratase [Nocardioides flavescens]